MTNSPKILLFLPIQKKIPKTVTILKKISIHAIPNLICPRLIRISEWLSMKTLIPPEYISEESLGNKKGYIIVNVRAGDESSAVSGATVLVTAVVDGNRMIIASGQTNQNGTTPTFEVPVPDISLSQSPYPNTRPYNLYDISVTAEGYFNARSVDVPVFESITSVQNFNMIPVPSMMNGNDETLTYFNQEPEFPNNADENGV